MGSLDQATWPGNRDRCREVSINLRLTLRPRWLRLHRACHRLFQSAIHEDAVRGQAVVCPFRTAERKLIDLGGGDARPRENRKMLISELGYRPPSLTELSKHVWASRVRTRPVRKEKKFRLPLALLSSDPFISFSGMVPDAPLGLASLLPRSAEYKKAWFLLSPTWSVETEEAAAQLRRRAVVMRYNNGNRNIVFMCNTPSETNLLRDFGEAAFFYNKTCAVDWNIFRPLPDARAEFRAIYNAQLVPWKRHELALKIGNCAFIFHRGLENATTAYEEQKIIFAHSRRAPGHRFLNDFDSDGEPIRMDAEKVNFHLNRAQSGLCLSGEEGAMFASTEYLLAGLPIVSTANRGGRDVYFDEEFCITVPGNASAVAEAVEAVIARKVPRDVIRGRTMERLRAARMRLVDLLNVICSEMRSDQRFSEEQVYFANQIAKLARQRRRH